MAIKIYGDKIVFPDNTEQTTASDSADTSYTKEEIDAQQEAQDVKIDKNTSDLTNVYTKTEVDDSQSAQDTEIAKKIDDAPSDNETYARNNKTWVSISESAGIPDAPVDGLQYGRQDGEWTEVTGGGTPTDVYTKEQTDDLLDEKADKDTTYTKTEVDGSQDAQDNAIANNTIAIQTNTDAIAALPTPVDAYTKAESDAIDNAQDVKIDANTNAIANLPTPVDTYTKTEIDTQQGLQDDAITANDSAIVTNTNNILTNSSNIAKNTADIATNTGNISSNTTAIGTLSGRVSANEADIATLQDGIFFSSSYSADYPASPNRDPQAGNMYMQDLADFTYSYADTNQVFISKTDEQGNVRAFTAVKPDDTIVLNQVESPNYGRYKVTAVNDLGDYVNLIVDFEIGEGTLLDGDTVALQAFPASESDSIWTEEDGKAVYDGDVLVGTSGNPISLSGSGTGNSSITGFEGTVTYGNTYADGNVKIISGNQEAVDIAKDGTVSTTQDIKVNDVTVGKGNGELSHNTVLGADSVPIVTGNYNTAVGHESGKGLTSGEYNTIIGRASGSTLTTGVNNVLIGDNVQPSSPTVDNEVTIGNDDVTKTRLRENVEIGMGVNDTYVVANDGVIKTKCNNAGNVNHHIFDGPSGVIGSIRSNGGNMYFDGLVTTFAQVEGLEAKLSAKDKLIEKLSARLDELEKKVK